MLWVYFKAHIAMLDALCRQLEEADARIMASQSLHCAATARNVQLTTAIRVCSTAGHPA